MTATDCHRSYPKLHEFCRPHRQEDHFSCLCLIYAALVANYDDHAEVVAKTVDRQRVGRMWTELDDKTIWDQNSPSDNDCFDAYPGCLVASVPKEPRI